MEKLTKKILNLLTVLAMVLTMFPLNSFKVEAFAPSRDDGTWLFPLPSNYYNCFSDWAGCPGYDKCVFCGVTHPAWGDEAHTGQGGHNGFDVGAPTGTNVFAAAPGKAYTFYNSARGNTVVIEHVIGDGFSYYSYYQHLSAFNVSSGQNVSAGTVVGKVGNTGASGGAHLHFGIVMGKSGQTGSAALLSQLEGAGWITTAGNRNGRILNNPAASNDAGYPAGYSAVVTPLKAHYGSTHYTFNAAKVSITNNKPSKPTLQTPVVNADSITFSWSVCTNTDDYDLYIYKEGAEIHKAIYDIKTTQYTMSTNEIPDGNYFFAIASTHNSSGQYTFSIRVPFTVNNTRRIFLESEEGDLSYQPKIKMAVDNVNTGRGAGQTIIYTSAYRKTTDTNYWGREIAVDKTGKIIATREYQDPNVLAIPDGGFVISMQSGDAYNYQISIGEYAAFNRTTRTVYVYPDESAYKLLTKTINREETIGKLPVFTWKGMALNGWKMKGQLIDVYTTKLSEDTVLQADWVIGIIRGDVDNDGDITPDDALWILMRLAGKEAPEYHENTADCDGKAGVTSDDALWILMKVAGKDSPGILVVTL